MDPLGKIKISFDRQCGLVAYYKMVVSWKGEEKVLELPRHHQSLGWIEIFGFPPQNEWVVLGSFEPFESKAILKINGNNIEEIVSYMMRTGKREHYIKVERKNDAEKEVFEWTENFSEAPKIVNTGIFKHSRGEYSYTCDKNILDSQNLSTLTRNEIKYFEDKRKELGKPSLIITKDCKAGGAVPPIFNWMFFIKESDVIDCRVRTLEIGYLRGKGSNLERAHGDWYKLIDLNGKLFEIQEKCGVFREEIINGKPAQIKDTYAKVIYALN